MNKYSRKILERVHFIGISEDKITIFFPGIPPCIHDEKERKPIVLPRKDYELIITGDIERVDDEKLFKSQKRVDIYLGTANICKIDDGKIICKNKDRWHKLDLM